MLNTITQISSVPQQKAFNYHYAAESVIEQPTPQPLIKCQVSGKKDNAVPNKKDFENFGRKFEQFLDNSPVKDIEQNFRSVCSSFLGKMNLVTREEFDEQSRLLQQALEKITKLEEKLESSSGSDEGNKPQQQRRKKTAATQKKEESERKTSSHKET